jgi:hypothetical protein
MKKIHSVYLDCEGAVCDATFGVTAGLFVGFNFAGALERVALGGITIWTRC